jgi:sorbitol-specific phosphotransferase system component IIC
MIILEIIWFVFVSLFKAIFKFLFSWCFGIFGWMLVIAIVLSIVNFIGNKNRFRRIKQKEKENKK